MSQWVRSDTIIWEELGGEAVLVDVRSRKTFLLNATASFIWQRCDGRVNMEALVEALVNAGRQEVRRVRSEIFEFCQLMQSNGLLLSGSRQAAPVLAGGNCVFHGNYIQPSVRFQASGIGFRNRPSSRGVSGPG